MARTESTPSDHNKARMALMEVISEEQVLTPRISLSHQTGRQILVSTERSGDVCRIFGD